MTINRYHHIYMGSDTVGPRQTIHASPLPYTEISPGLFYLLDLTLGALRNL